MVAGKLDPTVGQLCFLSYLSNGEESAKSDHVNEFIGSKNGANEVWVGLRWPENTKIWRPKFASIAAFALKFYCQDRPVWRSSLSGACTVVVAGIGSYG